VRRLSPAKKPSHKQAPVDRSLNRVSPDIPSSSPGLNVPDSLVATFASGDTQFTAGQIFAALRARGLIAGRDGSAITQHSNVASLARRIECEIKVPSHHDKALKRKAVVHQAGEKEVLRDRTVVAVGKGVRFFIEELD
jgi:hypothetical protein